MPPTGRRVIGAILILALILVGTPAFGDNSSTHSSGTVFNVKKFGAMCDGVTDDTVAVQKAVDAAEAAGGGVVEFPSGTCLLNSYRPSSHPWFFYNLLIGSQVRLHGAAGARLLQGPGGRHALLPGATEVRNTVLAVGRDYTVIRFQKASFNGGFYGLNPTTAGSSSVTLSAPAESAHFNPGDYVAIYKSNPGDVIPTEPSQIMFVERGAGVLRLRYPLARSFPAPLIANVTSLVTTTVAVENLIVQGVEPLAVTETFGFGASSNQFIFDTSVCGSNVVNVSLNTLIDFRFVGNTFQSAGPKHAGIELPQRNSQHGLFDGNTFNASNVGFGEYAAHITFTHNRFLIHANPSVGAGIFIGGKDVDFSHNEVQGGNITGGSGWGTLLADFVGPADYAAYVGEVRIASNSFDCRADGNACLGIVSPDTSVIDNTLKVKGTGNGIHVEGPLLQANLIRSNSLAMGTGDGMLIVTPATGGGGSIVSGNKISGLGSRGIYINAHGAPKAGGVILSNNTVVGFASPLVIH